MTGPTLEDCRERTLDNSYWLYRGPDRPSVGAWPQQTFRLHSHHCSWHRGRVLDHLHRSEHRLVSFGSRRRFDWSNRGRSSGSIHLEPLGREPRYQRSKHYKQYWATPFLLSRECCSAQCFCFPARRHNVSVRCAIRFGASGCVAAIWSGPYTWRRSTE
jgi:hypothetical protein